MRVNIGEVLAGRRALFTLVYAEQLEPLADDVILVEPVRGELRISKTGRTVRLSGQVQTRAGLVCSACLAPFQQPLRFAIFEEFGRPPLPPTGPARRDAGLRQEDFIFPVESDDAIDVTEVVRQHLLLALPIAPRCREDCRGLCPTCGAERNEGECGCAMEDVDPHQNTLDGASDAGLYRAAHNERT